MDKLIRTLALFGRPFPPELRELYFQVERNHPKRPAALADLPRNSADAAEGEPFERDSRAPEVAK
jgi:hypothetical protein